MLTMIFVGLPLPLGVPATSAQLSKASFMSYLLVRPPRRAGPSLWLALWYGMVSHWLSDRFLESSPRNFFSNLKQLFGSAGVGSASE